MCPHGSAHASASLAALHMHPPCTHALHVHGSAPCTPCVSSSVHGCASTVLLTSALRLLGHAPRHGLASRPRLSARAPLASLVAGDARRASLVAGDARLDARLARRGLPRLLTACHGCSPPATAAHRLLLTAWVLRHRLRLGTGCASSRPCSLAHRVVSFGVLASWLRLSPRASLRVHCCGAAPLRHCAAAVCGTAPLRHCAAGTAAAPLRHCAAGAAPLRHCAAASLRLRHCACVTAPPASLRRCGASFGTAPPLRHCAASALRRFARGSSHAGSSHSPATRSRVLARGAPSPRPLWGAALRRCGTAVSPRAVSLFACRLFRIPTLRVLGSSPAPLARRPLAPGCSPGCPIASSASGCSPGVPRLASQQTATPSASASPECPIASLAPGCPIASTTSGCPLPRRLLGKRPRVSATLLGTVSSTPCFSTPFMGVGFFYATHKRCLGTVASAMHAFLFTHIFISFFYAVLYTCLAARSPPGAMRGCVADALRPRHPPGRLGHQLSTR